MPEERPTPSLLKLLPVIVAVLPAFAAFVKALDEALVENGLTWDDLPAVFGKLKGLGL